jgi:hypothetical protein
VTDSGAGEPEGEGQGVTKVTTRTKGRAATVRRRTPQRMPPIDHLSFPNPDSVAARLVTEERRREPRSVEYQVTCSEEQMRRARSIPARHTWNKKPAPLNTRKILGPGSDEEILLEDVRQILEKVPIRRSARSALVQDDKDTDVFRTLVGLLLTHSRLSQLAHGARGGGSGAVSGDNRHGADNA